MQLSESQRWTLLNALTHERETSETIATACEERNSPRTADAMKKQAIDLAAMYDLIEAAKVIELR